MKDSAHKLTRRGFLGTMATSAAVTVMAACQPKVITEQVEKEVTKEVEKEVIKEVEKVVTATPVPRGALVKPEGVLKISHCPNSAQDIPFNEMLEEKFNEQYPDIKLDVDNFFGGNTDDYKMKKLAEMAAGVYPDVMYAQGGTFSGEFISKGIFMPIDEYIAADSEFDTDDQVKAAKELGEYQGKTYGTCGMLACWLLFFNKELFQNNGTRLPSEYLEDKRWTWQDGFLEAAVANTKGEGLGKTWGVQIGTGGGYWGHDAMANILWSNDADFFRPDPWHCSLDEPAAVDTLKYIADLYLRHKVAPLPGAELPQQYTLAWASMMRGASWFLSVEGYRKALEELADKIGIIRNPYGAETGYSGNQPGAFLWCIPVQAKNPGLAWYWLKWYNMEGTKYRVENYHLSLPVRRSHQALDLYLNTLASWEDPDEYAYAAETARLMYAPPNASEAVNLMMAEWDKVLLGELTVEEYVTNVKPKVDDLVQA